MWWPFGVLFGLTFLFTIVLSIPVAFDVGGLDTGLAYSLSLFIYYFLYSAFKIAVTPEPGQRPSSWGWSALAALRLSQWVVIPTLLIWALGQFAVDANAAHWVERTLNGVFQSKSTSWTEWVFGKDGVLETVMLGSWSSTLRYSGPVFQMLEGFCTLLVIQAAGQITRWLVNRGRSDTWLVSSPRPRLVLSLLTSYRLCFSPCPAPSSRAPSTSSGEWLSFLKSTTSMPFSSVSP